MWILYKLGVEIDHISFDRVCGYFTNLVSQKSVTDQTLQKAFAVQTVLRDGSNCSCMLAEKHVRVGEKLLTSSFTHIVHLFSQNIFLQIKKNKNKIKQQQPNLLVLLRTSAVTINRYTAIIGQLDTNFGTILIIAILPLSVVYYMKWTNKQTKPPLFY